MDRIRDKSKGKTIVAEEREEERGGGEVIDIMEALRRSLEGGRAPAKRAPAKRAAAKRRTTTKRASSKKRKAS
jgi:DNA end-binding protein Ku